MENQRPRAVSSLNHHSRREQPFLSDQAWNETCPDKKLTIMKDTISVLFGFSLGKTKGESMGTDMKTGETTP
jgi:hypothetical protein